MSIRQFLFLLFFIWICFHLLGGQLYDQMMLFQYNSCVYHTEEMYALHGSKDERKFADDMDRCVSMYAQEK